MHTFVERSGFSIDLRNTLIPFDIMQEPWAAQYAWMARIDRRGFAEFEIVDADVRVSLGRTTLVVTIMDSFSCWFEVKFSLESVSERERKQGEAGLLELVRVVDLKHLDDAEQLIGRKGAFRVASAAGDIQFMALGALDA
jgi:hypothetical protein